MLPGNGLSAPSWPLLGAIRGNGLLCPTTGSPGDLLCVQHLPVSQLCPHLKLPVASKHSHGPSRAPWNCCKPYQLLKCNHVKRCNLRFGSLGRMWAGHRVLFFPPSKTQSVFAWRTKVWKAPCCELQGCAAYYSVYSSFKYQIVTCVVDNGRWVSLPKSFFAQAGKLYFKTASMAKRTAVLPLELPLSPLAVELYEGLSRLMHSTWALIPLLFSPTLQ